MKSIKLFVIPLLFNQYCLAQKIDTIKPITYKASVKAIPNPISNKLNLRVKNFASGIVVVQIVNNSGATVYYNKRLVVTNEDDISIFLPFKNGAHYCIVTQKEKIAKCNFMVVQ